MLDFNTNNDVQVKLTPHGEKIYREWQASIYASAGVLPQHKESEEGHLSLHLWELMMIFGPEMKMGVQLFVDNIVRIPTHRDEPGFHCGTGLESQE